jgi:CxxC motif-containing protein
MKEVINIYCDESCHLQNDQQSIMALGAVYCPAAKKHEIFYRISEIKKKHNLIPKHIKDATQNRAVYEIKWSKVSKSQLAFYKEIIDYFFDDDDLCFRILIVPNKNDLDYKGFGHTHDTFYYKMYFSMLKVILNPDFAHNIYIDIKDTKSREKVHKLEEVLRNDKYDYAKEIIKKVQQVRSHEVELVQLADLLTGAVSYINRGLNSSEAKNELVDYIRHRSRYSLIKSTLIKERKFNIFIWVASKFNSNI